MKSTRLTPKRYQLRKEAVSVVNQGHPWIFRSHLSSAVEQFVSGQLLHLVDSNNTTVGFGLYDPNGLIGIRVLKKGATPPDLNWFRVTIDRALAKRTHLRNYTDAFRALHGENDHLPGIVLDVYGDTGVLQTYADSVDALGRYCARWAAEKLALKNIVWKFPSKRKSAVAHEVRPQRVLRGELPGTRKIREGKLELTVDIGGGQKSGAFLDLRGLRKWTASQNLKSMRVLNLFSYTGTLGLAAEVAGAKQILNVDISEGALDAAKQFHTLDGKKHRFITADVFKWLAELKPEEKYDLIIVDPPNMASQVAQLPLALKTYHRLYRAALAHLAPRGMMVGCCCTSRITRQKFKYVLQEALPSLKMIKELGPEDDHPIGFAEGDYLKILVLRA